MYKIISKYSKTGNLKYISHLDVLRFIQRAVKRANISANYSEGFNPHMKTSFGFPLSLGNESIGEYFELEIKEKINIDDYVEKMNNVLPKEMQILKASYSENEESIMSRSFFVEYIFNIEFNNLDYDKLDELFIKMTDKGIIYYREKKNKKNKKVTKEINSRQLIRHLNSREVSPNKVCVEVVFLTTQTGSMKTDEFLKIIEQNSFEISYNTIMKIDSLGKDLKPILE